MRFFIDTGSVAEVEERIRRALAVVPAERLAVNPDCGLKTRSPEEAGAKLRVMMEAVRAVREEIAAGRLRGPRRKSRSGTAAGGRRSSGRRFPRRSDRSR